MLAFGIQVRSELVHLSRAPCDFGPLRFHRLLGCLDGLVLASQVPGVIFGRPGQRRLTFIKPLGLLEHSRLFGHYGLASGFQLAALAVQQFGLLFVRPALPRDLGNILLECAAGFIDLALSPIKLSSAIRESSFSLGQFRRTLFHFAEPGPEVLLDLARPPGRRLKLISVTLARLEPGWVAAQLCLALRDV